MKSLLQMLVRVSVAAGLSLVATLTATAQDESPGIVRISKPSTRQVTPAGFENGVPESAREACLNGASGTDCPDCYYGSGRLGCRFGAHCHGFGCWGCCHNRCCSHGMADYFRCKFGYFIPTGAGGAGVPFAGKYARVYPQDPYYFDQRDGQAWGAQGYGIPMAVPLAPVVGHTYNYGWGTPSSRLTPVSRPAY